MGDMILTPGPLPGSRKIGTGQYEDGSILAFRKDGEEVLYASQSDERKGLIWIPVTEFIVNPAEIEPLEEEAPAGEESVPGEEPAGPEEKVPTGEEPASDSAELTEAPAPDGPFLRKRPTTSE